MSTQAKRAYEELQRETVDVLTDVAALFKSIESRTGRILSLAQKMQEASLSDETGWVRVPASLIEEAKADHQEWIEGRLTGDRVVPFLRRLFQMAQPALGAGREEPRRVPQEWIDRLRKVAAEVNAKMGGEVANRVLGVATEMEYANEESQGFANTEEAVVVLSDFIDRCVTLGIDVTDERLALKRLEPQEPLSVLTDEQGQEWAWIENHERSILSVDTLLVLGDLRIPWIPHQAEGNGWRFALRHLRARLYHRREKPQEPTPREHFEKILSALDKAGLRTEGPGGSIAIAAAHLLKSAEAKGVVEDKTEADRG